MTLGTAPTRRKLTLREINDYNAVFPENVRLCASGHYNSELSYWLADLENQKKPLPEKVKVLCEDGRFQDYLIYSLPLKKGMFGYILLPQDRTSNKVKVIFRGTDFNDLSSVNNNLEPWGPATASFLEVKERIFFTLKACLKNHYPNPIPEIDLHVSGHSQGATLGLLFADEFLTRKENTKDFDCITKYILTLLNTPGVPFSVAAHTNATLQRLRKSNKLHKPKILFGMVGGDPVQTSGMATPYVDLPPAIADVNMVKVDKDLEGNWLKDIVFDDGIQLREWLSMITNSLRGLTGAHSNVNFFALTDVHGKINVDMKRNAFYSNHSAKEWATMQQELHNKAFWTQVFGFVPKLAIHYFLGCLDKHIKSSSEIYQGISRWLLAGGTVVTYKINEDGILVPDDTTTAALGTQQIRALLEKYSNPVQQHTQSKPPLLLSAPPAKPQEKIDENMEEILTALAEIKLH